MIVNDELRGLWKEKFLAHFKALSRRCLEKLRKIIENCQDGRPPSQE